MIQFLHESLDDPTSDEGEDLEGNSNSDTEDTPSNFWPLFFGKNKPSITTSQRKLKSGQTGYQKPVSNPLSTSGKLVSRPLPQQTKHDYHKNFIKAVGKGNMMMENSITRTPGVPRPASSLASSTNLTPIPELHPIVTQMQQTKTWLNSGLNCTSIVTILHHKRK
jgi:hypothetical protein